MNFFASQVRRSRRFVRPVCRAIGLLALTVGLGWFAAVTVVAAAPVFSARIVAVSPHDPKAFTQGLLYADGFFYESTGLYGRSSLRRVDPATGKVVQRRTLARDLFGEGLARIDGRLFQLTWKEGRVLLADVRTLAPEGERPLPGEGWGCCALRGSLVVSDGSNRLTFYDPGAWTRQRTVAVTDDGRPVPLLNELETVGGAVWANVWGQPRLAVIDPETGQVRAWVDCTAVVRQSGARGPEDVLNGIAWDAASGRLWVTGKCWPHVYEIKVPGLPLGAVRQERRP